MHRQLLIEIYFFPCEGMQLRVLVYNIVPFIFQSTPPFQSNPLELVDQTSHERNRNRLLIV